LKLLKTLLVRLTKSLKKLHH